MGDAKILNFEAMCLGLKQPLVTDKTYILVVLT